MICDKLTKKIILVLIFSLISCIIFTSTVYAEDTDKPPTLDQMISSADGFLQTGEDGAIDFDSLTKTSDYIYNTLLVIAVAIAVIVGTYLGIKFMLESAEDKAKIKEALIPFIVGCFIIFGAFGIWKIAVNVGTSISGDSTYNPSTEERIETYEDYKKNNGNTDIETAKKLINLDVSKLSDSEKANYKIIIKQAKSNLTNYRGEIEERTELINKLNDKLKELDK